jgi:hypothetical protein
MLNETLVLLRDADFIRGEESVNRDALADALVEILVSTPVLEEAQIEALSLIIAEMRYRLFGDIPMEDVEDELDDIIRPLVTSEGKVNDKLPGELALCSKQVTRRLGSNGGTITLHKRGVFVTAAPELIEAYRWMSQKATAVRATRKLNRIVDMDIKRQPLMAVRRQALVTGTHEQFRLELPMGEDGAA